MPLLHARVARNSAETAGVLVVGGHPVALVPALKQLLRRLAMPRALTACLTLDAWGTGQVRRICSLRETFRLFCACNNCTESTRLVVRRD